MEYETLKKLAADYEKPLHDVDMILVEETNDSEFDLINQAARHITVYQGKKLRPLLALAIAKSYGEISNEHIQFAVITELLHTATLIHDDVLDEADVRRHKKSIKSKWGNQIAVLLGDYLFARAFRRLSKIDHQVLNFLVAKTSQDICEGEILQNSYAWKIDLSEQIYMSIIKKKTAELLAGSCEGSAMLSKASQEEVGALGEYGRKIGMAFQMSDDVLDLIGDTQQEGKTLGTDLKNGKITLPIIYLLKGFKNEEKRAFELRLKNKDDDWTEKEIQTLVERMDGFRRTRAIIDQLCRDAKELIRGVSLRSAQDLLLAIPDYIVARVDACLNSSEKIKMRKVVG